MRIEKISYTDYNGFEHQDVEFRFNFTKSELLQLEVPRKDGLTMTETLEKIAKSTDHHEIVMAFKGIFLTAYGVLTPDGRFIKSQQIRDDFEGSVAFDEIFMRIATDALAQAAFINDLIPADMALKANAEGTMDLVVQQRHDQEMEGMNRAQRRQYERTQEQMNRRSEREKVLEKMQKDRPNAEVIQLPEPAGAPLAAVEDVDDTPRSMSSEELEEFRQFQAWRKSVTPPQ